MASYSTVNEEGEAGRGERWHAFAILCWRICSEVVNNAEASVRKRRKGERDNRNEKSVCEREGGKREERPFSENQ